MSLLDPIINEFEPLGCTNLEFEFKEITIVLKNADPDMWDKREAALKRIGRLAVHQNTSMDELAKQIRFLKTTLQTQVEDLRSAIVRTSAALCVVLHERLNSSFHSIFEFLLPSFVKQLAVKAVPTRESAHECLLRIISGGECKAYNERLLRLIFSYSADKDKVIRSRISLYLHALCDTWSGQLVRKNLRDIIDYLLKAQADGESKVRSTARETIALLGADYPNQIATAVGVLNDPKQKKEIMKLLPDSVKELMQDSLQTALPVVRRTVSAQPRNVNRPVSSQGERPSRSSTGKAPGIRRGSAPLIDNPGLPRFRGPQISPALERRISRSGPLQRRISKSALRSNSHAPHSANSSLGNIVSQRSISEAPQRQSLMSSSTPNSRSPSPARSGIARPRVRGSTGSVATSYSSRRGSQDSTASSIRRVSQDSAAGDPNHRFSRDIMDSGNPESSTEHGSGNSTNSQQPSFDVNTNKEPSHGNPVASPQHYKGAHLKNYSLTYSENSVQSPQPNPRQAPERAALSPLQRGQHQRREDKQLIAAKLADTTDLLDGMEDQNTNLTNSIFPDHNIKRAAESPADLLTRLRNLREQVQLLPPIANQTP